MIDDVCHYRPLRKVTGELDCRPCSQHWSSRRMWTRPCLTFTRQPTLMVMLRCVTSLKPTTLLNRQVQLILAIYIDLNTAQRIVSYYPDRCGHDWTEPVILWFTPNSCSAGTNPWSISYLEQGFSNICPCWVVDWTIKRNDCQKHQIITLYYLL